MKIITQITIEFGKKYYRCTSVGMWDGLRCEIKILIDHDMTQKLAEGKIL